MSLLSTRGGSTITRSVALIAGSYPHRSVGPQCAVRMATKLFWGTTAVSNRTRHSVLSPRWPTRPRTTRVGRTLRPRSMAKPTLIAIALSTALLGSAATVSWGYRPATATELSVIRRVVRKEWRSEAMIPCPIGGSNTFHLDWAYVSTVDPRYALAEVKDSGCTYTTGYFVRRRSTHSERWAVVDRDRKRVV